jgi:DNA invertase Pin-like site-specific DNA recombinase
VRNRFLEQVERRVASEREDELMQRAKAQGSDPRGTSAQEWPVDPTEYKIRSYERIAKMFVAMGDDAECTPSEYAVLWGINPTEFLRALRKIRGGSIPRKCVIGTWPKRKKSRRK